MLQPNSLFNREFWTIVRESLTGNFVVKHVKLLELSHSSRLRAFFVSSDDCLVYDPASSVCFNTEDEAQAVCDEINGFKKGGVYNEK